METASALIAYLNDTIDKLTIDNLTLLDFDDLRLKLSELVTHLETHRDLSDDHAALRDDYTQRISGMLKAIAAAARSRQTPRRILDEIEQLDTMTGTELVAHYRRVAARFRDTFPNAARQLRQVTASFHPRLYK